MAAFIPGSHRTEEDFSKILNDENGECRWPQPAAQLMSGKAGDCFINFTSCWHSRGFNSAETPHCLIWQVIGSDGNELPGLYTKLRSGKPLLGPQAAL